MGKETLDLIVISIGILLFIMMGVGMLFATRWARRNNAELRAKGDLSQLAAVISAIRQGNLGETVRSHLTGSLSDTEKHIGKILAVIGIFICLVFLAFACVALIRSIEAVSS